MATYPSISDPEATVQSLQATVRELKEAVELLTGQRGPAGEDPIPSLEARLNKKLAEIEASVEVKNEAVVNETQSLARRTTAIASQFYNAKESAFRFNARYGEVIVTQTSKTAALAQRTTTLEAAVTDGVTGLAATRARLITEEQARATADTALAQRTTTLEATVSSATSSLNARISNEEVARAAGDQALAQQTNTLQTTVNGQTATLTSLQNSLNGVSVKYGVTGYVNGQTGGFVFTGVAQNNGGAVFNMEFNSNVTINGNLVVSGTVNTQQMAANAISHNGIATSFGATQGPGAILSVSVYVPEGAYLYAMSSWTQVYTGPSNNWNAQLYVNGTQIASAGGASVDVAPCLASGILVGAGLFNITLQYSAATNVYAAQRSLAVWVLKR